MWNCPFPPEWVAKMAKAAKACKNLTAEQIEAAYNRVDLNYRLPPGDFLIEPQDSRGLPVSWTEEYDRRHASWPDCCVSIYDYDSIPEVVITNGEDDWPLAPRFKVEQA